MDWVSIGKRIRKQREYMGFTRETLAEKIDVTPKFCSDIETGAKGMSVPTLCKISSILNLSVDYILFGKNENDMDSPAIAMMKNCPQEKLVYLEEIIKQYIMAIN